MAVSLSALREVFQRLRKAGLSEEVIQARREAFAQFGVFRGEFLGDFLQGSEVRRGIAVPEGVVGDQVEAMLEEVAQVGEVGWDGGWGLSMRREVKVQALDQPLRCRVTRPRDRSASRLRMRAAL